nr:Na+/H+ antiporter subunit G [Mammaliicoccus sp. Marseille-Q6498]
MNLNEIVSLIAALSILLGSIVALISAIGLVRFRDSFLRSHAATKSSTLSVLLTLSGVFIYFLAMEDYFSVRTLLTILFLYLTSPVAGHMIIRAAYNSGSYMYMNEFAKKGTSLNYGFDRKESKKDRRKRAEKRRLMKESHKE